MSKPTTATDGADRRRFSYRWAGQLWMSDVMHGPSVADGKRRRKSYLISFLDDATRVSPFSAFAHAENTVAFLPVFKQALIRRGVPQRLYVDYPEEKQMPKFDGNLFPHKQIALQTSA